MKILMHLPEAPVQVEDPSVPTFIYTPATNPMRILVHATDGEWLATFTHNARTVAVRGKPRTFCEYSQGILDTFNRTRNQSWGPAEQGGVWYPTGGADTDFLTAPGTGYMQCTTTGEARRVTVSNIMQDIDARVKIKTDKSGAGAHQIAGILFGYQDIDNHYLARLRFIPASIDDTFDRTAADGWGDAGSGQSWGTSGGVATDYAVGGGAGSHSLGSVNISRRTIITSVPAADFDITVKIKTNALASGASQVAAILGRYADSNNHYIFRIRFTSLSSREVFASIQKNEGGTTALLGSETTTPHTHVADTFYHLRAQAQGAALRLKVWPASQTEPPGWDVSVTDTAFTAGGSLGLRSILLSGNTNSLPVIFTYDDFHAYVNNLSNDAVDVSLQVRTASTYTTIGPSLLLDVSHTAEEWIWMRVQHSMAGTIRIKAWEENSTEPENWQMERTDTTYSSGRIGLRSIINTGTANSPITFGYSNFSAQGSWPQNPTVKHNTWVRVLSEPFTGAVDESWLRTALADATPDALSISMQYATGALPVFLGSLQIMGHSRYGPLLTNGTREEGADFNDYLGISWQYGSSNDSPEPDQFRCLDCSGFVRMVFGYRLGIRLRLTTLDGVSIPRISSNITNGGPGVIIRQSTTQLSDLGDVAPGDIVGFDADTSNPNEEEGQIDHVGIYLGIDTLGQHRFISSRKTANGPTFADVGGPSVIGSGTNLYARTLRIIRRF